MFYKFVYTTIFSFSFLLQTVGTSTVEVHKSLESPQNEAKIYTVAKGDTLGSIAEDVYGDSSYWTTLLKSNEKIKNANTIEKGWSIVIPEKPSVPDVAVKEFEVQATTSAKTLTMPASVKKSETASVLSEQRPLSEEQITFLGNCESGMRANTNTGNGYYGAFQFSAATWNSMNTGYDRADLAPLEVQKSAVQRLLSRSSIWTQFPGCAYKMRAAGLI